MTTGPKTNRRRPIPWRYAIIISVLSGAIIWVAINLTVVLRHKSDLEQRLSRLETVMSSLILEAGYGGFIHQFKNAVLRPAEKDRYLEAFRTDVDSMRDVLDELEALLPTTAASLAIYRDVLDEYSAHADFLSRTTLTDPLEIDRIVRVNDTIALENVVKVVSRAEQVVGEELAGFVTRVIFLVVALVGLCFLGTLCVFTMIVSVRRREAMIEQTLSVRLLAADMIERIGAALIQIGPDGEVEIANGIARAEFAHLVPPIGTNALSWFDTRFPKRAGNDPLRLGFGGHAVRNVVGEYLGPEGVPQFVMVTSVPLLSSLGRGAFLIELRDETASHVEKMLEDRKMRLVTLGTFAGGIIHDFRNVFSTITMALNGLRAKATPETPVALLRAADGAIDLGQHLADRLLRFVADGAEVAEPVSLKTVMKEMQLLSVASTEGGIKIATPDVPADAMLWGSKTALVTALVNLMLNARTAVRGLRSEGGKIDITVGPDTGTFGIPAWSIKVADNGPGFPDTVLAEFAGDGPIHSDNGFGIGLSVVHAVATEMGGIVSAENGPDGAEVTITLPAYLGDVELPKP